MAALIRVLRWVAEVLPMGGTGDLDSRVARLERLLWLVLLVELFAHHEDLSQLGALVITSATAAAGG